MRNNSIVLVILIFLLFASNSLTYAQGNSLEKSKSSVVISVQFDNQQIGTSSGFLIRKENRFFVILTTHCLHYTYQEEWLPSKISIYVDNGLHIIEISKDDFEKYHAHYNEGTDRYVDTTKIELTNIASFDQLKDDIKKHFLNYSQLAEDSDINNIGNAKLILHSIYGVKEAHLGEIMPMLGSQQLLGFEIINCTPPLSLNGGDSGGLIIFDKNGTKFIVGMLLKAQRPTGAIGYAVDSIRIKETIGNGDKTFKKSINYDITR